MRQRLFIAVLLLLGSLPALAAEVSGFRVWADPVKTRAVLDLDRKTAYKLFTLQNPHRVVVDLQGSSIDIPVELDEEHAGIIKSVRYGQPDKGGSWLPEPDFIFQFAYASPGRNLHWTALTALAQRSISKLIST